MASKKIKFSLDVKELSELVNLLTGDDNKLNNPLKRKLLQELTEDQQKKFIELEVRKVISRASGVPLEQIKNKNSLIEDLHLNSLSIRALAVPFTSIARLFNSTAVITPNDCEDCDTVDDCVGLVIEKSKKE